MGTIARSTWTDDDGSGTTGSIVNNSELQKIFDNIDAEVKSATNPSVTTKSVIDLVVAIPFAMTSYTLVKTAPAIAANVLTVNYNNGTTFAVALNANVTTLTLSNIPASGKLAVITLAFTADGTPRTIAWPASVKWSSGIAPTMTSTNGKVDIINLMTFDGGTTFYAFVLGQNL